MPAISAVDAIGPAIQRTRTFLFKPLRLPTFLKLCLVAVLTGGSGTGFNFSFPLPGSHSSSHTRLSQTHFMDSHSRLTPGVLVAIIAGSLLLIVVSFLIFYLITRLRFAYFHCLINNTREIRPGWRLYRTQAIRFFWLNVVAGICFLLLAAIISIPFVAGFWRLFHDMPAGGHPNTGLLLSLVLPLIPILFLFILATLATKLIFFDFMLPHFALENATAGQAWTSVWANIKREKLAFFVYALLRCILPVVAILGLFLVLIIPMLIVFGVLLLIGIGIHLGFAGATSGVTIIRILLEVIVGLVAFCIVILVSLCVGGPLNTAIREYALLFYGGRYARLGEFIFPPLGPPLTSPETA